MEEEPISRSSRLVAAGRGSSNKSTFNKSYRNILEERQLKVAVADEDYVLAARLRDEQKVLLESLPPVLQYALGQVAKLRSGTVHEQLQTISNLGRCVKVAEAGEPAVIPDLAGCLAVPELSDAAEKAMWALFMKARDPRINELMAEGCSYMRSPGTYDKALEVFNQIIKMQPSFVEGYNKRATVHYLMGRYESSIQDCQLVLEMQPYHFGAASGMGLCQLQLSKFPEALSSFESALAIHPGMANIRRFVADLRRHVRSEEDGEGLV
ncbi:hypothetical protein VOLCADRAFT_95447 [Volvox carteri f. nagariensis]|uniref:Uncharacterized protein n=1 Tax=Volvox carteri f. nagariensis TaxID=3068 RepID=D8U7H1_VOLCA|nr:uncharacterized protein VOLCADRAFT_95447 [Volvox carteri f. nagariensis]EFJ44299.1 hypothetical protein VOLCADRAFT_95447 [Volvox carteri f. nagariensis]|eukprot:XP_002954658.1 hypothetical protein VOLCADRAFT_95447 [Volvox carteri f. nagariensis]